MREQEVMDMDKEERKAAEAERLTEDLSDYLDEVS